MSDTIRIYPKPGLLVRDPLTREPLPAEGKEVSPDDVHWIRRLRDGDVSQEDQREQPEREHGVVSRNEEQRNQRGERELADEEPAR
jgi:hypothetical protein